MNRIEVFFLLCYFIVPTLALLSCLAWWFDRPRPMAVRRPAWRLRLAQRIRAAVLYG